jgi:exodeoxyribonuclease V beta subunit
MLRTPLGTSAPLDFTLADITRSQRLDELRFDFSLAHLGDPQPTITAIGRLLVEHLAVDDPLQAYARRLAEGQLTASFSGLLNGFVDLIVRLPADPQRLLIVDYKSNRLPSYGAAPMLSGMVHHHYPLQGLLYAVALFRWLRWRLGEPDPSHRLAGFAYLFVRGMVGPHTPHDGAGRVDGVFYWHPPQGLIPSLSDLLSGLERRTGGS